MKLNLSFTLIPFISLALSLLSVDNQQITHEQATATCRAQAKFEYDSCRILGGNVDYCVDRADKWYIDCMSAHGWTAQYPSEF